MGKLHTLKRAIQRNPDKWHTGSYVYGAFFWKGKWCVTFSGRSYRNFIIKVLKDMGKVALSDNGQG